MIRKLVYTASVAVLLLGTAVGQDAKQSSANSGKATKIAVGNKAPDFTVTGIDGKPLTLSERLKNKKNIVLCFNRALW